VNGSRDLLSFQRRPVRTLGGDESSTDFDFNVGIGGSRRKVEDGSRVVGESSGEVIEGETTIVDCREEELNRLFVTSLRRVRFLEFSC